MTTERVVDKWFVFSIVFAFSLLLFNIGYDGFKSLFKGISLTIDAIKSLTKIVYEIDETADRLNKLKEEKEALDASVERLNNKVKKVLKKRG